MRTEPDLGAKDLIAKSARAGGAPTGRGIEIRLVVTDPDVTAELQRRPAGEERDRYLASALRVGVLALRQAGGAVDTAALEEIGKRIGADLAARGKTLTAEVESELRRFLDPKTGAFAVGADRMLRAHLGSENSTLAGSLAKHLEAARAGIVGEFSLDRKDSALSRLVAEMKGSQGELSKEMRERIDRIEKEAQAFHAQVHSALAAFAARREVEAATPRHGLAFEAALAVVLREAAGRSGDAFESTGATTGVIKNCKKGDAVVVLGAESRAAGARIVWEAKEVERFGEREARAEIEEARRNRAAQVGVFVYSAKTAPAGIEPLAREGRDLFVVWNAEEEASDLLLRVAYSVARALAAPERAARAETEKIVAAVEGVRKEAVRVARIETSAETARAAGEKILGEARLLRENLDRACGELDRQTEALRAETSVET